ncbi:hypothetical protein [Ensifer sp. MJa1]|uniref:hypothetical protein n=1 Tax=Ensifer sp. MJa1 TaxID=2919888 RepID=UPI00300BE068
MIVTTDKVVRALVDGAVGFSQAESLGLVRLYGDARRQTELRRMLRRALVRGAAPEAIGHVNSTF